MNAIIKILRTTYVQPITIHANTNYQITNTSTNIAMATNQLTGFTKKFSTYYYGILNLPRSSVEVDTSLLLVFLLTSTFFPLVEAFRNIDCNSFFSVPDNNNE